MLLKIYSYYSIIMNINKETKSPHTSCMLLIAVGLCFFSPVKATMDARCPKDWIHHKGTADCYLFHNPKSWIDASDYCSRFSATLASIPDISTKNWLAIKIAEQPWVTSGTNLWTSARLNITSQQWYWLDTGELIDEDVIKITGSNGTNHKCAIFTTDDDLKIQDCMNSEHFVCLRSIYKPFHCDIQDNWNQNLDKCYQVSSSPLSWHDGNTMCRTMDGHLVIIDNERENTFVADQVPENEQIMWIGMSEVGHPGNFTWIDNQARYYDNFMEGQPESIDGIAGVVISTVANENNWLSDRSTSDHYYLCEKPTGSCLSDWREFDGSCFYFNFEKIDSVTWMDANHQCEAVGASLPVVLTPEQNQFIVDNLPLHKQYWLGLYSVPEDQFYWTDNTTLNSGNFSLISDDAMNSAIHATDCKCVYLEADYDRVSQWTPTFCTSMQKYVCMAPLGAPIHMNIPPGNDYCPPVYQQYLDFCYSYNTEEVLWPKARSTCNEQGGDLVSLVSWEEQDRFTDEISDITWIGLNRRNDNVWKWSDGSSLRINNWAEGEPENNTNTCSVLDISGKWVSRDCGERHGFICKVPALSDPISTTYSPLTTPQDFGCDLGWSEDTKTGVCYIILNEELTRSDANTSCNSFSTDNYQANLLTIVSQDELYFINHLIRGADVMSASYWIGLTNDPHHLHWINKDPVALLNWDDEVVFSRDEVCVEMDGVSGKWNVANCLKRKSLICEKIGKNYIPPGPLPRPEIPCPDNWIRHKSHCYYYYMDEKTDTLTKAQARCNELYNSSVVSIKSSEENMFIYDNVDEHVYADIWIGLAYNNATSMWEWIDDQAFDFSSWLDGQPNHIESHQCAKMMTYSGTSSNPAKWYAVNCVSSGGYYPVCKMKSAACPINYTYKSGKCYYLNKDRNTWSKARQACQKDDSHCDLLSIHSSHENDLIDDLIPAEYDNAFIGLHYKNTSWAWSDGNNVDYTNWKHNYPSIPDSSQCASISFPKRQWTNINCDSQYLSFCEFKPSHTLGCEDEWTGFSDYCYMYYNYWKPFNEAEEICKSTNSHLASIGNQEESDFLRSFIDRTKASWVGLFVKEESNMFEWTDGNPVYFTDFDEQQKNLETPCVQIYPAEIFENWVPLHCSTVNPFVCKKLKQPIPILPPDNGCQWGELAYDTSCYKLSSNLTEWNKAVDICKDEARNGHLLVINNRLESSYVSANLGVITDYDTSYWIGLKLTQDGDSFYMEWVNQDPITYTNWGQNSPDPSFGLCVRISSDKDMPGMWDTRPCDSNQYYICEYDRPGYTAPPTPPSTLPPDECPEGWSKNDNEMRCYKVFQLQKTWNEAEADCTNYGGHLMTWSDNVEQQFTKQISNLTNSSSKLWLGFLQYDIGGYDWVDGTPFDYIDWAPDQPDSHFGRELCGVFQQSTLLMEDYVCDDFLNYICEIQEGPLPTTAAPPSNTPDIPCPSDPDWLLFNDSCYKIYSQSNGEVPQSWWTSSKLCSQVGGYLASIHSYEENYWILSKIFKSNDKFWIGGTSYYNSFWEWIDGSVLDFINWNIGEPNNNDDQESCMSISSYNSGYWNDDNCGKKQSWICKKSYKTTQHPPASTPQPNGHCPQGWTHINNKCFKIFSKGESYNMTTARNRCKEIDGTNTELLSIHSSLQQATLMAALNAYEGYMFWVGLKNKDGFHWTDQTVTDYVNWGSDQPDGLNEDSDVCTYVKARNGLWYDDLCNISLPYICQQNIDPSINKDPVLEHCAAPLNNYIKYGEYCFLFNMEKMNWKKAESRCQNDGAHLSSVGNLHQSSFIFSKGHQLDISSLWIGLNYSQPSTQFEWSDGWPVVFTNWKNNEPNISVENHGCVSMNTDSGLWNTELCSVEKPFVCRYTEATAPTPDPPIVGGCPNQKWQDFGGHYCYFYEKDSKISWDEANTRCLVEGGNLTSIHSTEEQDLLNHLIALADSPVWIGLIKMKEDYSWSDGTSVDFIKWQDNEPSDDEMCVQMSLEDEGWNDWNCKANRLYICKAEKKYKHTTIPTRPSQPTHLWPQTTEDYTKEPGGTGDWQVYVICAEAFIVIMCLCLIIYTTMISKRFNFARSGNSRMRMGSIIIHDTDA